LGERTIDATPIAVASNTLTGTLINVTLLPLVTERVRKGLRASVAVPTLVIKDILRVNATVFVPILIAVAENLCEGALTIDGTHELTADCILAGNLIRNILFEDVQVKVTVYRVPVGAAAILTVSLVTEVGQLGLPPVGC
jgi:hypothetical protein